MCVVWRWRPGGVAPSRRVAGVSGSKHADSNLQRPPPTDGGLYCTARHIPPYRFVAYTVIYRGIGRTLRASAVGFTAKAEAAVDAARCRPAPCRSQQDSSQKVTEVGCLGRLYKYFIMRNQSAEPVRLFRLFIYDREFEREGVWLSLYVNSKRKPLQERYTTGPYARDPPWATGRISRSSLCETKAPNP